MSCAITPISAFQSTNLNNRIDSFGRLADRIVRMLGAPIVSVEIHQDQLFEAISIACEMYTQYAGYTKEYIVFDSNLYERGKGIRLDHLYTIANTTLTQSQRINSLTSSRDMGSNLSQAETVFVVNSAIPVSLFAQVPQLSADFTSTLEVNQIIDKLTATNILTSFASSTTLSSIPISTQLTISKPYNSTNSTVYNNMFDYDLMDYRKVIDVTEFEEGSTAGINTLFTIEQTLAQQTYFSYAMGNYGFDLISWYALKEWLDLREKLLATRRSIEFNDRTQYLRMYPEPTPNQPFYGVIPCYVEKPLRDIIKEQWVFQYALSLVKIMVGNIRTKIPVNMFGGQTFGGNLGDQGLQEKQRLEEQLFTNAAGFGSSDPVMFRVG